MIYRSFQGMELSNLGLGCMRLPILDGDNKEIDRAAVKEMVAYAMAHGINYYDTAWPYHGGNSETVMGEVLSEYPRDQFYLASKFPGFDPSFFTRVPEIFEKQLEKCQVDYFDFYLFHNVNETNIDSYLNPEYGVRDYLMEQKKDGRIRHLGFSCHGQPETLRRFLDAYGKDLEFCQLQMNFLDWKLQKGKEKVDILKEYGIPLWVMEPLRGGKLVPFEPAYEERLKALRPEETDVGWCFRFLQTIPEATVILSGMSDLLQLKENIATFETDAPLDENEWAVLTGIADDMLSKKTLPCTGCRYCTDYCPMELDIPLLISLYNEQMVSGGGFIAPMVLRSLPEEKWPTACLGCRSCEQVCPQGIKISEAMSDFGERMKKRRMKNFLVVVDMQKDFVNGALGTKEAEAMTERAAEVIRNFDEKIFVTFDTHSENYLETAEGKKLPVRHCIKDTEGWQLDRRIAEALKGKDWTAVEKNTFGSVDLPRLVEEAAGGRPFTVKLIGLCTDICVVSNALLLKAHFPEMQISVDSTATAGVTPELHEAALKTIASCQIEVL